MNPTDVTGRVIEFERHRAVLVVPPLYVFYPLDFKHTHEFSCTIMSIFQGFHPQRLDFVSECRSTQCPGS